MKVIDLTHTIRENISVYPWMESPEFTPVNTYENNGFRLICLLEGLHWLRLQM